MNKVWGLSMSMEKIWNESTEQVPKKYGGYGGGPLQRMCLHVFRICFVLGSYSVRTLCVLVSHFLIFVFCSYCVRTCFVHLVYLLLRRTVSVLVGERCTDLFCTLLTFGMPAHARHTLVRTLFAYFTRT